MSYSTSEAKENRLPTSKEISFATNVFCKCKIQHSQLLPLLVILCAEQQIQFFPDEIKHFCAALGLKADCKCRVMIYLCTLETS